MSSDKQMSALDLLVARPFRLVGAIVLLLVSVIIVLYASIFLFLYLAPHMDSLLSSEPVVSIIHRGVSVARGEGRDAHISVAATEFWQPSGIFLKPNQKARIRAKGKVHLAINRLVEAAQTDSVPSISWTAPSGYDWVIRSAHRAKDEIRGRARLYPEAGMGALLCIAVASAERPPRGIADVKYPVAYFKDGSGEMEIINSHPGDAELYFVVNDIYIDLKEEAKAKAVLFGESNSSSLSAEQVQQWKDIMERQLDYLFWLDNIGSYEVEIRTDRLKSR